MKISQIADYSLPTEGGLPPLQSMVYEELMRRSDEVFEYQGDELIRIFPRMKRSALNWSLWLLAKTGHISAKSGCGSTASSRLSTGHTRRLPPSKSGWASTTTSAPGQMPVP